MRLRCANCRKPFLSEDNQTVSKLYGTHGVCSLCDSCAKFEQERIKAAQTNSIPDLLSIYISATGYAQKETS